MIRGQGLECRFRLDRPAFCLDIDLELPARGVTAIFGPSGSGKTTLLRCVAGLERAPGGWLSVAGEVWQDGHRWVPTHRRSLGFVFQEPSLFPHLSVAGNLRYGQLRGTGERRLCLDGAVELLGLGALLDRRPDQLSGGERQRVAIARALATAPRLLLMDEPLASLDMQRKLEILPYLERLHAELEIPVLYVSHAADEVERLADHLLVLEAGRALASGPLAETLAWLDSRPEDLAAGEAGRRAGPNPPARDVEGEMTQPTGEPWKATPRWRISRGPEVALGPGKAELLAAIDRSGSISGAARELEMSYRRAWLLAETMNRCFRQPLVATTSFRRGGASLTVEGKEVLALYRQAEDASRAAASDTLRELEARLLP